MNMMLMVVVKIIRSQRWFVIFVENMDILHENAELTWDQPPEEGEEEEEEQEVEEEEGVDSEGLEEVAVESESCFDSYS